MPLQTSGGMALQEGLGDGRDARAVVEKLNTRYRASRLTGSPTFQTN